MAKTKAFGLDDRRKEIKAVKQEIARVLHGTLDMLAASTRRPEIVQAAREIKKDRRFLAVVPAQ